VCCLLLRSGRSIAAAAVDFSWESLTLALLEAIRLRVKDSAPLKCVMITATPTNYFSKEKEKNTER
jgi:hypothetical protein